MEKTIKLIVRYVIIISMIMIYVNVATANDGYVFNEEPIRILSAKAGDDDGQFGIEIAAAGKQFPTDFVVDMKGNIWIMDFANNRVQKFNKKGRFLTEFPNDKNDSPVILNGAHIECDLNGNIFIGPNRDGDIVVIDVNGGFLRSFKMPDVSREEIDFSINQNGKILYTQNNTNIMMDTKGVIINKEESKQWIMGSKTSPYSPYRIVKKEKNDGKYKLTLEENKIGSTDSIEKEIEIDVLSEIDGVVRKSAAIKVDKNKNYFVRKYADGNNYGENITYMDEDGKVIAELKETETDLYGEKFPYTCYSLDNEGNFYRLEVNYPSGATVNGIKYLGGTTFLQLWKWER